jgi:hypothetical protein
MHNPLRTLRLAGALLILATGCSDLIVRPEESNLNLQDFEFTWNIVNDIYPLLEQKGIDWDAIHILYRARTEEARGDEFYGVLFDLLAELRDPHVYFLNKGRGLIVPYPGPRLLRDRDAYSPVVTRRYFDTALKTACLDRVDYGILEGDIGYIYIASFNDEGMMQDFDDLFDGLLGTNGLIIDVRRNTGGLTENVEEVVARFLESPLPYPLGFTKGEVPYIKPPVQPESGRERYTAPTVVLINGATVSGGELLAEMMKQVPTVTVIGDTTTGGMCSDYAEDIEGDYFLPSGRYINISTTYSLRYDGILMEENGVPPHLRVVQSAEDGRRDRDPQLEAALELLRSPRAQARHRPGR